MTLPSNRPRADAGGRVLFTFQRPASRAAQAGRSDDIEFMCAMTFSRGLRWGFLGAGAALVICWLLMFTAKSVQPILTFPLDSVVGWIDSKYGVMLIPHENIAASFVWLSVYFLALGFLPASVAGMVLRRRGAFGA